MIVRFLFEVLSHNNESFYLRRKRQKRSEVERSLPKLESGMAELKVDFPLFPFPEKELISSFLSVN
tara:strand:+ start:132311 stop:132508 length:198 start_codon:yes stop_codon:yes gene_type:complete